MQTQRCKDERCRGARVQGCRECKDERCRGARFQECKGARINGCRVAKGAMLQCCKSARVQECSCAVVQGFKCKRWRNKDRGDGRKGSEEVRKSGSKEGVKGQKE